MCRCMRWRRSWNCSGLMISLAASRTAAKYERYFRDRGGGSRHLAVGRSARPLRPHHGCWAPDHPPRAVSAPVPPQRASPRVPTGGWSCVCCRTLTRRTGRSWTSVGPPVQGVGRVRSEHGDTHPNILGGRDVAPPSSETEAVHLRQLLIDLLPADRSGPVVVSLEGLLDQLLTQGLTVILGLHSSCSHESDFLSGLTAGANRLEGQMGQAPVARCDECPVLVTTWVAAGERSCDPAGVVQVRSRQALVQCQRVFEGTGQQCCALAVPYRVRGHHGPVPGLRGRWSSQRPRGR